MSVRVTVCVYVNSDADIGSKRLSRTEHRASVSGAFLLCRRKSEVTRFSKRSPEWYKRLVTCRTV